MVYCTGATYHCDCDRCLSNNGWKPKAVCPLTFFNHKHAAVTPGRHTAPYRAISLADAVFGTSFPATAAGVTAPTVTAAGVTTHSSSGATRSSARGDVGSTAHAGGVTAGYTGDVTSAAA